MQVLVITNRRVLLLDAQGKPSLVSGGMIGPLNPQPLRVGHLDSPSLDLSAIDFIWLQGRVMTGEVAHVTDVPGGEVIWQLPWEGLLAAELAWHQQQPGMPPDGILLHRKRRGGRENSLIHDVRCRSGRFYGLRPGL